MRNYWRTQPDYDSDEEDQIYFSEAMVANDIDDQDSLENDDQEYGYFTSESEDENGSIIEL